MNLSLSVPFLVLVILVSMANSQDCEQLKKKSDDCIRRAILIGDPGFVVPKTLEDMGNYCTFLQQKVKCAKQYGKCLRLFPKQIFNIIFRNIRTLFKDICSAKGKEEFLHHMKCSKPEYLEDLHHIINKITIHMNYIAENVSRDDIIPWACCAYYKGYEDIRKKVSDLCLAVTGIETVDFLSGLYRRATTDAIDLACGRYASTSSCLINLPNAMTKYHELVTPDSKVVPQETSFFVPLIKIAEKLDSE